MNPTSRTALATAVLIGLDLARGPDHIGRFRPWAGSYMPPAPPVITKAAKDRSAIKAARKQSRKNRSKK